MNCWVAKSKGQTAFVSLLKDIVTLRYYQVNKNKKTAYPFYVNLLVYC
jgi:hypothetical protein